MHPLETKTRKLFSDYGRRSNDAVRAAGTIDAEAIAKVFADHFVGASPLGVSGAAHDADLPGVIAGGFEHYRAVGGTRFEIVSLEVEILDEMHAMARVDWEFDYVRPVDGARGTIAFRNIYFVNAASGEPRIFAWITPDEGKAMREHGLA